MMSPAHVHDEDCGCPLALMREPSLEAAPRVVIVGAGFGGLSAAMSLRSAAVHVTLIDKRNHHLFQPLLYQVATAGLAPSQIAAPIRSIVGGQRNADVVLAEVEGVDREARCVIASGVRIPYDYLILATGARHSYFGHDEWAAHAPGLKSLEDATALRARILTAFERAELEPDAAKREALLTFVVVGGGPTGVEVAGAIAELAHKALAKDFRRINTRCARILLVEAGPKILATFPDMLSAFARSALEKLGVDVRTGVAVSRIEDGLVALGEEKIASACVIWAAGVASSPAARWLNVEADRAGRAKVGADLSIPEDPNVFVIGDCAHAAGKDGKPLPGLAPVAKQQGEHVAKIIRREIEGKARRTPFRYKDFGAMATIGRGAAIADFGAFRLRGALGWLVWSLAHVYFLIGFRNRIAVAADWLWSYFTFQRGSRLITEAVAWRPVAARPQGAAAADPNPA